MKPTVRSFKVSKAAEERKVSISMVEDEEIVDVFDVFDDIRVQWCLVSRENKRTAFEAYSKQHNRRFSKQHMRCFELRFHKKHKDKVLNSYLPYVLDRAKVIREERRVLKLHTVEDDNWNHNAIDLVHPMTFETLAIDDLNEFVQGKDFYRKIGKAWKRGYLLYGPPGTGKSSLIAAMSNYLNYDIYDLDLTDVHYNNDLRSLLLGMSSRSILVMEDIDCITNLQDRKAAAKDYDPNNKVNLSGMLNFIDGLCSCCGEERIFVFTTNHKVDPALLRPGRMDMHIHLSYCTISAFKPLALNYLGIRHHRLFEQIEGFIGEINVTPAEVAGELMKSTDAEVSLQSLVKFLLSKKTIEQHTTETNNEK